MTSAGFDTRCRHAHSVEEFSYLWDGSEEGWVLWRIRDDRSQISLNFDTAGPSISQIKILKKIIPAYQALSASELLKALRGKSCLELEELSGREAKVIADKLKQAGMQCIEKVSRRIRYGFIKNGSMFLTVENDLLHQAVVERAIKECMPMHDMES
ncbi:hypothetical protein AAFM71_05080 [Chromobacterium violaceum]|uniref:hypothetical protein n=1 Tax=Chromobacterium violaceum TaxID=536 RepID=UPI0015FB4A12|nr:hypothetical protein [Chromobacterium violaceum]MBA8733426.1 hypothetical protein [Chromobacterium violaceum]